MRAQSKRQAMRRLKFENLEARWLLTGVAGVDAWRLGNSQQTDLVASLSVDQRVVVAPTNRLPLDSPNDAEGEASDTPALVTPLQSAIVSGTSVTLKFAPLPGYTGKYMVRLHDTHWDGRQAAGFQHDSNLHYLSITTASTEIAVSVEPGETYSWWVCRPGFPTAGARFNVTPDSTPAAPSPDAPQIVSPLQDEIVAGRSVTLRFAPLPGYTGKYMVRLHDTHWDGRQAPGFQHDSQLHYLSIATTSTEITVPVESGETYTWWVHKPGFPANATRFSAAPDGTPPAPSSDSPGMLSPLQDEIVTGRSVTLKFAPLPGYTGKYMVRLHDMHWDGRQASGFQHDSKLHYLSIATTSTEITVPVEPGETYTWWAHKPGFPANAARFSVTPDATQPVPSPDIPRIVSPLQDDVITGAFGDAQVCTGVGLHRQLHGATPRYALGWPPSTRLSARQRRALPVDCDQEHGDHGTR